MALGNHSLTALTIMGALERGPKTFRTLLECCHSMFPNELQDAINQLMTVGVITQHAGHYQLGPTIENRWSMMQVDWQENLDQAHDVLSKIMSDIHLPHCLDYEWWFAHTSRESLARHVLVHSILPVPSAIAFLGSPIFGAFTSFLLPETDVYILDRSAATLDTLAKHIVSDRLKLINYDAEDPLPSALIGRADMAFFDPPWYVDYYDLFFRRCAQLTSGRYSTVATVLFPTLTRPSALQERQEVFRQAMSFGMSLIDFESQLAHYLTPRFELEALSRQGIQAKNWRRGDLAIFVTDAATNPENIAVQVERFKWHEAIINKVKIKVKKKLDDGDIYIKPIVTPVVEGEARLASVSRRDPIRDEIDLWTATHRGFKVQGSEAVWRIVQSIKDQITLDEVVERVRAVYSRDVIVPPSLYNDVQEVWEQLIELLRSDPQQ